MHAYVADRRRSFAGRLERAHQPERNAGAVGIDGGNAPPPRRCLGDVVTTLGAFGQLLECGAIQVLKPSSFAIKPALEIG